LHTFRHTHKVFPINLSGNQEYSSLGFICPYNSIGPSRCVQKQISLYICYKRVLYLSFFPLHAECEFIQPNLISKCQPGTIFIFIERINKIP